MNCDSISADFSEDINKKLISAICRQIGCYFGLCYITG